MTSDSEFVAFINHAIQLALDLTTYSNNWAVNTSYVQVMHDFYNQCYTTRTEEYMVTLEKAAEQSKNNMYNNTLDGVSAYVQQSVCNSLVQPSDQHDANAENHTPLLYNACFNDILTEYPAWSTDTNDIENTNEAQYRSDRQDILTAWQKDTPVKTPDNRQVLDNLEAYAQDNLNITKSLNDRLSLTENIAQGTGAVPGLYSHIAQSQDQDSASLPKPFKSTRAEEERKVKVNPNHNNSLNHLPLPLSKKNSMKM